MFAAYARLIVRRPVAWLVVLLTLALAVGAGVLGVEVEQDDDVLAFLPRSNPDIEAFYDINESFGSTDVALVGIAAPEGEDVFSPDFLRRLEEVTDRLRDTPGLDSSLTLINVSDFVKDEVMGGIITSTLVDEIPTTEAGREALRAKVMSRDHIVGTLVSEDGRAVQVLAFATPGTEPRALAENVRAAVEPSFEGHDVYWGGAPFLSTWIFETTQADMARLTPWSVLAIVIILLAAFRDVLGAGLGLLSTAIGISTSRALMVVLGMEFNIVLSSMPIILFAVGSAYAIHMLSRYDSHARAVGVGPEAVARTVAGTGPTVLAAGLTTVFGLLSFVMMDIAPMRSFGVFTAVGLTIALGLSLTFVPAVMALFPRPLRRGVAGPLQPTMIATATWARTRRVPALVVLGTVVAIGASLAGQVDARMDLGAFFERGTSPAEAQRFLDERFGGSQFIQVLVEADLEQPGVLREVARVADRIAQLDHVSDVAGVHVPMEIIGDALTGARRIPDRPAQVGALYRFLSSDPSVSRLVTDDRRRALLQIKVDTQDYDPLHAALAEVETLVATEALTGYRTARRDEAPEAVASRVRSLVVERVLALAHGFDAAVPGGREAVDEAVRTVLSEAPAVNTQALSGRLVDFLTSDECFVEVAEDDARAVAAAVVALGPSPAEDAVTEAVGAGLRRARDLGDPAGALPVADDSPEEPAQGALDPMEVDDLSLALTAPLDDLWRSETARAQARALVDALGLALPEGPAGDRLQRRLASKLADLASPTGLVAAEVPPPGEPEDPADTGVIRWTVNGMPVLYRGLSRSVSANQVKSLGFALVSVFLIMTLLFRSPLTGALATLPTLVTLTLVYGAMGALGVHLDIGTSMLASLILGAGVDYAVHLLSAWEAPEGGTVLDGLRAAVHETSHGIWTNAIMVAAGFFVLTLGDAKPLQNVGGLTSAAMITAAVSTFFVIPLFANRRRYGRSSPPTG